MYFGNLADKKLYLEIFQNYNKFEEYNIVFGLDHVICFYVQEEEYIDISGYSKEAAFIQFQYNYEKLNYFFYPYFFELFITILSWGWNICFYSTQRPKIDEILLEKYFTKFLAQYTKEPKEFYRYLLKEERIRIFSGDMIQSTFTTKDLQGSFDLEHLLKKDLSIVSEETSNTILIEHFRPFVLGGQYPYIALDGNASINFSIYFELILEMCLNKQEKEIPVEFLETNYSASNNAFYIGGILSHIKNLLKLNMAYSLRQALDIAIHNKEYYKGSMPKHIYDTPWHLSPIPALNPLSAKFIRAGEKTLKDFQKKSARLLDPIMSQ